MPFCFPHYSRMVHFCRLVGLDLGAKIIDSEAESTRLLKTLRNFRNGPFDWESIVARRSASACRRGALTMRGKLNTVGLTQYTVTCRRDILQTIRRAQIVHVDTQFTRCCSRYEREPPVCGYEDGQLHWRGAKADRKTKNDGQSLANQTRGGGGLEQVRSLTYDVTLNNGLGTMYMYIMKSAVRIILFSHESARCISVCQCVVSQKL